MATLAEQIPPALMHAERKAAVIEWIRATSLPSRFKRRLLQDWGAAVGAELEGTDYVEVTKGGSHATE